MTAICLCLTSGTLLFAFRMPRAAYSVNTRLFVSSRQTQFKANNNNNNNNNSTSTSDNNSSSSRRPTPAPAASTYLRHEHKVLR